jgi:hypothetical protein
MSIWVVSDYLKMREAIQLSRFQRAGVGDSGAATVMLGDVVLLDVLREVHNIDGTPVSAHMPSETLQHLRNVSTRYPTSAALLRYAVAEGLNGQLLKAQRTLQLVCQIHSEQACADTSLSWSALQKAYPQLMAVPVPVQGLHPKLP